MSGLDLEDSDWSAADLRGLSLVDLLPELTGVLDTVWKADTGPLEPTLVGRGGGELSEELGGWSMKSYHRSSQLWPLEVEVRVPASDWPTVSRNLSSDWPTPLLLTWPGPWVTLFPLHSMKLLLLEPVP